MINIIKKDISTVTSGIVAHGCNCLGLMGSGVALAIRNTWVQAYIEYVTFCDIFKGPRRNLLGMVQTVNITDDLVVANCFTQEICGNDGLRYADLRAVKEALENVFAYAQHRNMPVYIPKIGCGYGGLSWEKEVEPLLLDLLTDHPALELFVCEV